MRRRWRLAFLGCSIRTDSRHWFSQLMGLVRCELWSEYFMKSLRTLRQAARLSAGAQDQLQQHPNNTLVRSSISAADASAAAVPIPPDVTRDKLG
jgi:hypothetical protein